MEDKKIIQSFDSTPKIIEKKSPQKAEKIGGFSKDFYSPNPLNEENEEKYNKERKEKEEQKEEKNSEYEEKDAGKEKKEKLEEK